MINHNQLIIGIDCSITACKAIAWNKEGKAVAEGREQYGLLQPTDQLNQESLVVVKVEGKRGVDNITEIVSVPDIDVIFLSPYDLSHSLGIPGQVRDERVINLMKQCIPIIRDAGKTVGTFADNSEITKQWIDWGIQYYRFRCGC